MAKKWKVENHKITRESSEDKRTARTTKKLLKQLEEFKPSEIAKKLKISVQKWTAIKKDIKAGKIYGRKNNAKLDNVLFKERVKHIKDKPTKKEIKKLKEQDLTRAEKKRAREIIRELEEDQKQAKKEKRQKRAEPASYYGADLFDSVADLRTNYKTFKVASYPMSNARDAVTWWKKVGAGKSYFAILKAPNKKTGTNYYYVVDIDPNRTRAGSKQKVNKYASHRAEQIYQKFLDNSKG